MPNLSAAQITGIVSLALVLTGVIVVENLEESYYCEPEDNVKECYRLSSSGLTCYYWQADDLSKGDRCTGGVWELLNVNVPVKKTTDVILVDSNSVGTSDNCMVKGKWCYCNPRGSLDNRRLC